MEIYNKNQITICTGNGEQIPKNVTVTKMCSVENAL